MFFQVLASDKPGALPMRLEHRAAHVAYWQGQADAVKVAGAMLGGTGDEPQPVGSSFLIEAADVAEVRALLAADPFTTQGIFSDDIRIQAVRPAIGNWFPG
ncbi:MAG: hypothetical protein RIS94_212 [Pseudomonadota bacterium]